MRTISEQELKDILDKHGKWLRNEENGERANLRSADLRSTNLSSADLSSADLSYANLRSADLSYADLSSADLSYANLSSADLSSANLRSTNLSYAIGFKHQPIQLVNTRYFATIFDDYIQWGCRRMTFDEVNAFKFEDCTTEWKPDEFKLNKKIIAECIRYYRKAADE